MKHRIAAFLSILLIVVACSTNSTNIVGANDNGTGNNNNNNGSTMTNFLAKISRVGSPVAKGSRPAASDVFWLDSSGHEHSFLTESHGKVAVLCLGGLWSIWSSPMFNLIDSLQNFYGHDSLYVLRTFEQEQEGEQFMRDSIASYRWHGRFVYETNTAYLVNYDQVGGGGIPLTVIVDRQGRVTSVRLGGFNSGSDAVLASLKRMVDSARAF